MSFLIISVLYASMTKMNKIFHHTANVYLSCGLLLFHIACFFNITPCIMYSPKQKSQFPIPAFRRSTGRKLCSKLVLMQLQTLEITKLTIFQSLHAKRTKIMPAKAKPNNSMIISNSANFRYSI